MLHSPKTVVSGFSLPLLVAITSAAFADEPQDYPDQVFWGDTHVHTYLSQDAYIGGARVTPDQAYRFAKGEVVTSSGGQGCCEQSQQRPTVNVR